MTVTLLRMYGFPIQNVTFFEIEFVVNELTRRKHLRRHCCLPVLGFLEKLEGTKQHTTVVRRNWEVLHNAYEDDSQERVVI